jgi:hypothetical protein
MTKIRFGRSGPALNGRVGFDAGQLPYKSVFIITFREKCPQDLKIYYCFITIDFTGNSSFLAGRGLVVLNLVRIILITSRY